jgi:putative ABC transport system permease protein
MFALALRSSMANKRRLVGTALSVLLGVAFLAGTLVFTDTIASTFDRLFASIYEDVDTYVRSDSTVETEMGGEQRGRLPASVAATVAEVDGVADAQGFVGGFAQIVDADGDAIGNPGQGAPTFGMSYAGGELGLWELTDGSVAPGPGEVVIDQGSADRGDLAVGDRITVLTQTGPHEFDLVGTATFGSVDSPGGASTAIWELATAQEVLLGGAQEIDAVLVGGRGAAGRQRGDHGIGHGGGDPGLDARGPLLLQHLPARLRRSRPRRGGLHDLQHLSDHRHAAHP